MIDAAARDRWSTLRADLTPFVARRVSASDVDDVLQDVFVRVCVWVCVCVCACQAAAEL